ncbi:SU10 major capsid protein [Pseudomonas sp.]|uniref:SU10 major capsid protein n=1 Tax=Pseudomonas sp. TaxID=306 RepID=UPI003F3C4732
MTQPTNTFDSYDAVGNREDLQDKIYMVSPEKTPIVSAIGRFKATQRLHEWQRDNLDTPNKDNAVIEGDDRTGTALTPTERVANTVQLFDKVAVVSSTQEKTKSAGRSSEMKYQISKKMVELKRDLEAMVISNNPAVQGNSTTARKSAGLGVLLYTNTSHGAGGSTTAHTSGLATVAPVAGTARAFAEAQLKTVMQSIYTNSGEMPSIISMTPSHKAGFSAFTGIAASRVNVKKGSQATIVGGADVYMSDFGELTVVPNYVQATANSGTVFILNPEYAGIAYLGGFKSEALAKTGHTEKELVSVEACLVVTSEKAHGKIADLTA